MMRLEEEVSIFPPDFVIEMPRATHGSISAHVTTRYRFISCLNSKKYLVLNVCFANSTYARVGWTTNRDIWMISLSFILTSKGGPVS
ncbi:hypothetical protein TNCT_83341 [Trichonephila clavata]|uniref:Uncharacterized protein n=1 Tax=Trichonephila clavata TaxID=2740835 RepID=A0A8X6GN41_TRICU|nr:hypothetical protein TNCT_83341 [Trichonephila clavata]